MSIKQGMRWTGTKSSKVRNNWNVNGSANGSLFCWKNTLCWYLVSSLKQPPTRQVKQIINSLQKQILWKIERFMVTYLQTQHVYSTLKRRGNDRFQVFSTWNTRGGFVGYLKLKCWNYQSYDKDSMGFYQISREVWMNHP